jgi:hypothetical protein
MRAGAFREKSRVLPAVLQALATPYLWMNFDKEVPVFISYIPQNNQEREGLIW